MGTAPPPTEADCQSAIGVTAQAVGDGDVVYAGGGDSAVYAVPIAIADTAPQIFLTSGRYAAALNQDYSVNAPNNPAIPGDVVSIFWTDKAK